jgi:MerR family transcriptional regulator, thiopeptide resistance regulator
MKYTVKKLSALSKVSERTLHYYDQIGLLKPAYLGLNGYRYYEEKELLLLQQILFFKELGFELKKIKKIINGKDFDKIIALTSHKMVLQKELIRIEKLLKTIDKTIKHLKGVKKMNGNEMYLGFDREKQTEYENYLVNRFGDSVKSSISESKIKLKNWKKEDFEKSKEEFNNICKDLSILMKNNFKADSKEVQDVILRHYNWIKKFWTPNKESYTGLGLGYTEFVWKEAFQAFDSNHPKLAQFLSDGIKVFANENI